MTRTTTPPIRLISSMATRELLARLAAEYESVSACRVRLESVGGVDAAKRVQAGEPFDVVVLASDAIQRLMAAGKVVAQSSVDLVDSDVAVAVRAKAPHPAIDSEDALKRALLEARSIGCSTGPSGVQLAKLFERWGIAERIGERIVQAPPGVPVGSLIADGTVEIGFQQLSELMNLPGIDVLGPLPAAVRITTTFSGAVVAASTRVDDARALLDDLAAAAADDAKRANGMEPV